MSEFFAAVRKFESAVEALETKNRLLSEEITRLNDCSTKEIQQLKHIICELIADLKFAFMDHGGEFNKSDTENLIQKYFGTLDFKPDESAEDKAMPGENL